MAQQFNGIIANQIVPFRGSSSVGISTSTMQSFRSISGAVYTANLAGGQSGTLSVHVLGSIGDNTYVIAGFTALDAVAGNFVLYPATYAADGTFNALETAVSIATRQIDQIVPPATVVFEVQGGSATATGVSTTITVSACIHANR